MDRRTDIQRRDQWIYQEFERLRKGKHPRYRGRRLLVDKALEVIRGELRRKKQFRCNRNLRKRTIHNIIYGDRALR
jgi:hypothetical protein